MNNASCFRQFDYGSPVDMDTDALIGIDWLDSDFHWNWKILDAESSEVRDSYRMFLWGKVCMFL